MKLHEKTLELNITHELLNLSDSWHWFLSDIPLWRYWRPRYKLPFFKYPKSTAAGFHITTEGKNDPTGNAGGGYDVRIKSGVGEHLLFIQYKKGELVTTSPDLKSVFNTLPHDHFKFKINSTSTNQHFVLRKLAKGIGAVKGNAVVYAFPLISDMNDLEKNAGKLIRKTKFVPIFDIDEQAKVNQVSIQKDKEHNFRICKSNMDRCEVNFFFFFFNKEDRTPEIITDMIAIRFQKTLSYFINEIKIKYKNYGLNEEYIPEGIKQSFIQYTRFLLHYFEVSPYQVDVPFIKEYLEYYHKDEFDEYESDERDIKISTSIFKGLEIFEIFINSITQDLSKLYEERVPNYTPKILINNEVGEGFNVKFGDKKSLEVLEGINYLSI